MACTLTTGRKLPCKSGVGGLKTVYFADYGTLGAATITGGEVTALAGTPALFQFDIKGNSSLDFNIQLRKLNQEFLSKKWQIERNPKTGNPTYKEPSVIVI